jgi:hypothetical protein
MALSRAKYPARSAHVFLIDRTIAGSRDQGVLGVLVRDNEPGARDRDRLCA